MSLIVLLNLIPATEFFIAITGGLIIVIIYSGWWGFKNKIENKEENREFYAPIHAMIVRANNNVSRKKALELSGGAYLNVNQLGIDYRKISETFDQNSTKFKNEDLKKWIELEKQIKQHTNGGGFFLGRDIQEWFDDLERRYND